MKSGPVYLQVAPSRQTVWRNDATTLLSWNTHKRSPISSGTENSSSLHNSLVTPSVFHPMASKHVRTVAAPSRSSWFGTSIDIRTPSASVVSGWVPASRPRQQPVRASATRRCASPCCASHVSGSAMNKYSVAGVNAIYSCTRPSLSAISLR